MDPGFTPCGYIANLLNRQPFNFNCTLRPRTPQPFYVGSNPVGVPSFVAHDELEEAPVCKTGLTGFNSQVLLQD